ncbi:hypothetical protein D3C80_717010 [compost metagenome]
MVFARSTSELRSGDIVVFPRTVKVFLAPGSPVKFWILTPATRPCNRLSKLGAGRSSMDLPEITWTALVVFLTDCF